MKIIKKKIIFIKSEKKYTRIYYYNEDIEKVVTEKMGHDPEFMVQCDGSGWYVSGYFSNDEIFLILGMNIKKNKYDFQERVLGYTSGFGNFPYCKTSEDAVNLLDEALKILING